METLIAESAVLQYVLFGLLIIALIVILLQQTQKDDSLHVRMPDVMNINPITISAMYGDIEQYIYTILYSLAGKEYIILPDNIFDEEAKVTLNTRFEEESREFSHDAEKTVFTMLQENPVIQSLSRQKSLKAIKRNFKEDKRKVRDLRVMRKPATIRKNKFLYMLFLVLIIVAGLFLIANRIMNDSDYAIPLFLTGVGVLFFIFYRRPFDKKSNLGKKFIMDAIKRSQNNEFPENQRMAYHTALFGYDTYLHKGSRTHKTITTPRKPGIKPSSKRPVDREGQSIDDDYDGGIGGDDGD